MTIDLLNYKAKFDEREKELHKFKMQIEQNEYDAKNRLSIVNSQLIDREDYLNRLQDEVIYDRFKAFLQYEAYENDKMQNSRRLLLIEQLEKDNDALKRRHDAAIQEIGRLESRIQTCQYDSKNETDVLNSEVKEPNIKLFDSSLTIKLMFKLSSCRFIEKKNTFSK